LEESRVRPRLGAVVVVLLVAFVVVFAVLAGERVDGGSSVVTLTEGGLLIKGGSVGFALVV